MGKVLMIVGGVLLLIGLAVWMLERSGFRGLPGDLRYEGQNVKVYLPIVTSIVISLLLTALLWLFNWFSRR